MDLLIGLDVGTTGTKAIAFDPDGHPVASATKQYGLLTPEPGWVEQNPLELWDAVATTLRSVAAQIDPGDRVLAIAQSSQGGTTIPVDAQFRPTYNAISWMDGRGDIEQAYIGEMFGTERLYRLTGWKAMPALPLVHLLWLRKNRPESFERIHRVTFVNDYIGWRLTGELGMNPADASITQLFDIARSDWDDGLLALGGIGREQVSPVLPSGAILGYLTAEAAAATGLPPGTLIGVGAHDQYCAAVSAGATHPGATLLSCGTAWVILAIPPSLEVGLASRMGISCHAVKGRWGGLYSLGAVGTSMEWLAENIWGGWAGDRSREELYAAINEGVARSEPGAGGLLFFPLAGGHGEIYGVGRGGFVNLTLPHTRDDIARAVMEAVAFELRWAIEEIGRSGVTVQVLKMVGGASRSSAWPQIVADVTCLPVALPAISQAASWGAAILAGVTAGVYADAEAGLAALPQSERRLEPSPVCAETYARSFEQFRAWSPMITKGVVR
jgi:sugar (pentulose or hexulose) kinase